MTFVPGNHDIYVREAAALAARQWGAYMCDDDGEGGFPFVRRRGNVALIGLSTGVPTAPFLATGWLGTKQLAEFAAILNKLKDEDLFRDHTDPSSAQQRHWTSQAIDGCTYPQAHNRRPRCGLLLHGHDHRHMVNWLHGPNGTRVPAIGVPSASSAPGRERDGASYNLYQD